MKYCPRCGDRLHAEDGHKCIDCQISDREIDRFVAVFLIIFIAMLLALAYASDREHEGMRNGYDKRETGLRSTRTEAAP